jgi:hypothetical protein
MYNRKVVIYMINNISFNRWGWDKEISMEEKDNYSTQENLGCIINTCKKRSSNFYMLNVYRYDILYNIFDYFSYSNTSLCYNYQNIYKFLLI